MMQLKKTYFTTTVVGLFVSVVYTQSIITPSTCVSPNQYDACYQKANQAHLVCSADAGTDSVRRAVCDCDLGFAEIACALESCWNAVYGCEYQSLAFAWDAYCGGHLGDIPFFPAPENAPGGCSCNLGYILGNFTKVTNSYTPCSGNGNLYGCGCCLAGGQLTSVFSICPNTDLTALGLGQTIRVLEATDSNPAVCAPYFKQYDCINDLNYPSIGTLPYLHALPTSTGTIKASTTGGSITTPLGGPTFVLTGGTTPTTIVLTEETSTESSSSTATTATTVSEGTGHSNRAHGLLVWYSVMVYLIFY